MSHIYNLYDLSYNTEKLYNESLSLNYDKPIDYDKDPLNGSWLKTRITEGNFSLIETSIEGANKIANHLAKDGIIVRRLDSYNLPNFLRISIGTKEEMLQTIESLKNLNE